jgi:hypothetical protein
MKIQISISAAPSPVRAAKKAVLKVKTTYKEREWWKKMSVEQQAQYLQEHPNSSLAERHNGIVTNVMHKGISTVVNKVKANRIEYKEGFDGLKNFKHGRELSDTQKAGVKKIAKTAALVLVGALALALLFTPAGGAARSITEDFLQHFYHRDPVGDSDAVASADDDDDSNMKDFTEQMALWLKAQDLTKYAKKSKKAKAAKS